MAFSAYKLPPTFTSTIEANTLYGKPTPLFVGGEARVGVARLVNIARVDREVLRITESDDGSINIVIPVSRKTTDK